MSSAMRQHERQQVLGNRNGGEVINLHDLAHHLHGGILNPCTLADTGIKKSDINRAKMRPGFCRKSLYGFCITKVTRQHIRLGPQAHTRSSHLLQFSMRRGCQYQAGRFSLPSTPARIFVRTGFADTGRGTCTWRISAVSCRWATSSQRPCSVPPSTRSHRTILISLLMPRRIVLRLN